MAGLSSKVTVGLTEQLLRRYGSNEVKGTYEEFERAATGWGNNLVTSGWSAIAKCIDDMETKSYKIPAATEPPVIVSPNLYVRELDHDGIEHPVGTVNLGASYGERFHWKPTLLSSSRLLQTGVVELSLGDEGIILVRKQLKYDTWIKIFPYWEVMYVTPGLGERTFQLRCTKSI